MTRSLSLLIFALLVVGSTPTLAADWKTDAATSRLEFVASAQGSDFKGRFRKFTPRIRFDPANPAAASFDVSIDLASVDTRNAERDQTLPGADLFWTQKYPRARFTATGCSALPAAGRFQCQGTLALRGKSRKLAFPFTWKGDSRTARLNSSVTLNRLDYGIGAGEWADPATIGHRVNVKIALLLRNSAPTVVAPPANP